MMKALQKNPNPKITTTKSQQKSNFHYFVTVCYWKKGSGTSLSGTFNITICVQLCQSFPQMLKMTKEKEKKKPTHKRKKNKTNKQTKNRGEKKNITRALKEQSKIKDN